MSAGRNAYFCRSCHGLTLTDHADPGVTPMFIRCRRAGLDPFENPCKGTAASLMYPPPNFFALLPIASPWEWFASTDAQRAGREALSLRRRAHEASGAPSGDAQPEGGQREASKRVLAEPKASRPLHSQEAGDGG